MWVRGNACVQADGAEWPFIGTADLHLAVQQPGMFHTVDVAQPQCTPGVKMASFTAHTPPT